MAVTYGFYDSLNHDRLYNAQQMSAIFDGVINDGVFASVGNQLHTVAGSGMQVIVKSGRAWFNSTWTLNDAEYPLTISAADVLLTRIDAVVLEVNSDQATRANGIKVVKGTPASTPAKPTLTNTSTVHQHALAYVTVAKNTTAITNSMIEIVVGKTETPYVTAILQTTDITDLFKNWEDQFKVWFETVKGTLDGDVALNLQNQIDHCVKKADKATAADIEAGTADKWVDSETLKNRIEPILDIGSVMFSPIDYGLENESNGEFLWCDGRYLNKAAYSEKLYNKMFLNPYRKTKITSTVSYTYSNNQETSMCWSIDGHSHAEIYNVSTSSLSYCYIDLLTETKKQGTITQSLNSKDRIWFSFVYYPYIYVIYYGNYSSYPNYTSSVMAYNINTNSATALTLSGDSLPSSYLSYLFSYQLGDNVVRFFFGHWSNETSSAPDSYTAPLAIIDFNISSNTIAANNYSFGRGILNLFVLNKNVYMCTHYRDSNNYNVIECLTFQALTPGSLSSITNGNFYNVLMSVKDNKSGHSIDPRCCTYNPTINYTYVADSASSPTYYKIYSDGSYEKKTFYYVANTTFTLNSTPINFIQTNNGDVVVSNSVMLCERKTIPASAGSSLGSFYSSVNKILPVEYTRTNNYNSNTITLSFFNFSNRITIPVYNGYIKVK